MACSELKVNLKAFIVRLQENISTLLSVVGNRMQCILMMSQSLNHIETDIHH